MSLFTGGLNLMRHAKKSTNRDFRITFMEVPEAAEEQVQEDEEAEKGSDAESQVCSFRLCRCVAFNLIQ